MRRLSVLLAGAMIVAMVLSACAPAPAATATPVPATQVLPTAVPIVVPPTVAPVVPTQVPSTGKVVLPVVDAGKVTGDIIAAGSSTVFPLAERMAERFRDEGYSGKITISSIGSGAGFERFCKTGETDIANASRPIKSSEVESAKAIGRVPIEFRVGTDALAVVVNKQNTFLKDVKLAELAKIFSSEAVKWSDVNASWPAEDIKRYSPGTDSGTFDYFVEEVMIPAYGKDKAKEMILKAPGIQLSEDDNVLVRGVEGSPYAIGYFGYAYYQEEASKMTALMIEGVAPTQATVDAGTYKLARPLFMYSDAQIMKSKPQVAAYLNFMLTYVNEEIKSVGYFPAPQSALDGARQAWLDALK